MDPTPRLIHALESLAATPSGPPIAPPQARWEVQVAGAACRVGELSDVEHRHMRLDPAGGIEPLLARQDSG